MRPGYGTNSVGDVDPWDALPVLREIGYRSIAITLDHHVLDPFAATFVADLDRWREALRGLGLASVIETGARHLLDRQYRHEPTLVSAQGEGRRRRIDFLGRAIDVAAALGAQCVSLWSGIVHDAADEDTAWTRLVDGLGAVLERAEARGVTIGFEPEPGMFVDTVARYVQLRDRLGRPERLRLTLDIGHMECMGERPAAGVLADVAGEVVNVHVDDMLACRHEHLPLGSGDVDFQPVLRCLAAAGYAGGVHVELPRQSHRWVATARDSYRFLAAALRDRGPS